MIAAVYRDAVPVCRGLFPDYLLNSQIVGKGDELQRLCAAGCRGLRWDSGCGGAAQGMLWARSRTAAQSGVKVQLERETSSSDDPSAVGCAEKAESTLLTTQRGKGCAGGENRGITGRRLRQLFALFGDPADPLRDPLLCVTGLPRFCHCRRVSNLVNFFSTLMCKPLFCN